MGSAPDSHFRFLHAADLHLDSPLRGLAAYDDAPVDTLRGATRRAFDKLVAHAIERRVAFVVIAGDLYDGEWREVNTGHYFLRAVRRLGEHGIRVYVLHGNHDFQSAIVQQLRGRLPENLTVFPADAPASFEHPDLPVVLHGQSYGRREIKADLTRAYPPARPGLLNVGVLHTSAEGYAEHATYAPCTVAGLTAHGYQYWALGHVHEARTLSRDPWIVFPGNLQGRNVRETGVKGCVEVECAGARVVSVTSVPLDVLRWHRLSVDVTGAESEGEVLERFQRTLRAVVAEHAGHPCAARVVLSGETPAHRRLASDAESLRERLALAAQGEGEVWLEKLRLETRAPAEATGAGDTELLGLLSRLADAPENAGSLLLASELADLDERFKPVLRAFGEGQEPGQGGLVDPAELDALPREGLALLAERLAAADSKDTKDTKGRDA
jgi:exonuclease SbcD